MPLPLPSALLSRHAIERAAERFTIAPEALASLMNEGLGKKIGTSKATNLIHRLLWSPEDNCLLVAIQEVVSGTVLTFLTIEMYMRDYAENVSDSRIRHVINQMVHASRVPATMWQEGDNHEYVTVHAHLADAPLPIALGRWTGHVNTPDLSQLGKTKDFWNWVARRLNEKQLTLENLMRIEARFTGGQNCEVPYLVPSDA